MPQNMQQQGRRESQLRGERRADTEAQLLQNLLTKGVDTDSGEINDYMATSFLDDSELGVLRDQQELLSRLRRVANLLGYSEDQWQKTSCRKELLRRMITISQSSKSKGGVGMKTVRTEKVVQEENLYQTQKHEAEEGSMFDKIMDKVGGSNSPVVGNPNLGTYGSKDPGRW